MINTLQKEAKSGVGGNKIIYKSRLVKKMGGKRVKIFQSINREDRIVIYVFAGVVGFIVVYLVGSIWLGHCWMLRLPLKFFGVID